MHPVPVLGAFFTMLAMGMPIFLVLGALALFLFWHEGDPLIAFSQLFIDHLNSETLIAIPFFVMAATFMKCFRVFQGSSGSSNTRRVGAELR